MGHNGASCLLSCLGVKGKRTDRMVRNFVGKKVTENTMKKTSFARDEGKTCWKAMEVMWKWSVFLFVTA